MNRISLRILSTLSFAAVMTVSAYAAEPVANLTPQQANVLVSTANTPAQHAQVAHYYRMQADQYAAEAKVHQQMIAAYEADATKVSNKNRTATVGHCENEVRILQAKAVESQKLAQTHELAAGISPAAPAGAQSGDDCCCGKCNQSAGECCHGSAGDCCGGHMNMNKK